MRGSATAVPPRTTRVPGWLPLWSDGISVASSGPTPRPRVISSVIESLGPLSLAQSSLARSSLARWSSPGQDALAPRVGQPEQQDRHEQQHAHEPAEQQVPEDQRPEVDEDDLDIERHE